MSQAGSDAAGKTIPFTPNSSAFIAHVSCIVLTARMGYEAASLSHQPIGQISSNIHRHCRLTSPPSLPCTCSSLTLPLLLALSLLISLLR